MSPCPSCPCLKFFNFWFLSLNNNEVFLQLTGLKQHPQETRLWLNPLLYPVCNKSFFLLLHELDLLITLALMSSGAVVWSSVVDLPSNCVWKSVSSFQTFLFFSTLWPPLNEGPFSFRALGFQKWLFHNILNHHFFGSLFPAGIFLPY